MEETKKQLKEIEQYTKKLKRFITIIERSACVIDENSAKRLAQIQQNIENAHTAIEIAYDGTKLRIDLEIEQAFSIPCIECNQKLWEHLKSYLEKWGYQNENVTASWDDYPLLVLNYDNSIGYMANLFISKSAFFNRELVTDPEEFLTRAAKLKGFEYKPK